MKARIHVNQHKIRSNYKHGLNEPVITIKRGGKTIACNAVAFDGPCRIVYSPDKPLSCGARVWIETEADLTIEGERHEEVNKTKV